MLHTCIITIVKNEHLYLSEWIKYHLDLGVEHIFVFEDIDSASHKDIVGNNSNVTLQSINAVLNDSEQETAKMLKQTKKWNAQHLYLKNALKHVANNYQCDWCFVIDVDEFITLDNGIFTLTDALSLYNKYNALIMLWKCFGASGNISIPNYKEKGVIETYTNAIDNKIIDKPQSVVKTCYNLHTFKTDYFYNQHRPSNKCNWCNTDFKRNINATYKNIYIRHYVTKSWQEFYWKKKVRGFLWGGTRTLDMFFNANTEFKPLKNKLISNARIGCFTI